MDPNEALKRLRAIFEDPDMVSDPDIALGLYQDAATTFAGLDEWIKKGGFLPKDWNKNGNDNRTGS